MRRLTLALVLASALALGAGASAGTTTYAVSSSWSAGTGAGSSFGPSWWRNLFYQPGGGADKTVTFIDNVTYGWHSTVRNAAETTYTYWLSSQVKKPHCRANTSFGYGACTAYS